VSYAITFAASLLGIAIIIALASRRKKFSAYHRSLIYSQAIVEHPLNPTGTVLVHGELWRARSQRGSFIPAEATVTVVGLSDHLLLVE